jgi:hypothetical protein
MRIKIDDLAKTIRGELLDFEEEKIRSMKNLIDKESKETVKELHVNSPENTGKYAKGWKRKTQYEDSFKSRVVVHNSIYQLTHLLEKGHAKRNGGRVEGIPHIEPAAENTISRIERGLKQL